jgi:iron(III)-salmochelin esterase
VNVTGRRELLLALLAIGCSRSARREETIAAPPPSSSNTTPPPLPKCPLPELVDWHFGGGVSTHTALLVPSATQPAARYPVLVALHGRGEALKGPESGALGWPNDYALKRALTRICAPPLTVDDFEGLVMDDHLADMNREIVAKPWSGLIVACPYLPDLDLRREGDIEEYKHFLVDTLLPRVHKELPSEATRVGIDGVSLGGAVALRVGLRAPETFAAVGTLQPAIDAHVDDLLELARAARAKRPSLSLRLTTSQDDYYRDVTRLLSTAWQTAGIAHDFSVLPGPHDYVFNRGPGAYEMLTWQRRVLT